MLKNDENVVIEKATKGARKSTKKTIEKKEVVKKSATKKSAKQEEIKGNDTAKKPATKKTTKKADVEVKEVAPKKATKKTAKVVKEDKIEKGSKKVTGETEVKKAADKAVDKKTAEDKTVDSKTTAGVKKSFKGKEAKAEGCKCNTGCNGDCGCKSEEKKYGNVTLTCRADVLADICGVSVARLVPLFNMKGVKLKFIADFKPELYEDVTIEATVTNEDEDLSASFEDWLRLNSFKTSLELATLLGNTTAKDIADAAKSVGVELNTCRPVDSADLDFMLNMLSNSYSIYEIAEKLSTSVQKIKDYAEKKVKKQRPTFTKVIKISGLEPSAALFTPFSCMRVKEIADSIGCSLSQANEFARQQGMRVVYLENEKPKRATYKDLERLLEDLSTFDMIF